MAVNYIAGDDECQEQLLKRALPSRQARIASTKRSSHIIKVDAGIALLAMLGPNVLSLARAPFLLLMPLKCSLYIRPIFTFGSHWPLVN